MDRFARRSFLKRTTYAVGAATALAPAARLLGADDTVVPRAADAPRGEAIRWRLTGPGGGGWIHSIAFDPHEKDVLYVGCDVGGFYFSSNGGRSYEIRNRGLRDYFIEVIAVHPGDPETILLGTESGIHRTTDRGQSWQWIRSGFPPVHRYRFTAPIGAVCFDPGRPNVVYAAVGRPHWDSGGAGAIYRSDDTGQTWRRVDGGQLPEEAVVSGLAVKPDDSRVLLAATSEGLFRSEDEGENWRLSSEGLPHGYTEKLAFAPSSPERVYLTLRCTARGGEPWNGGVYRSDDAGRTWQAAHGEGMPRRVDSGSDARHFSSNPKSLAVDPRDADVVYVGNRDWVTAGIYKSTDGGEHWRLVTHRTGSGANMDYGWITFWGPQGECLALSPAAPDRLAFGTSGHVFLTDDAGSSWQQRYTRQLPDGRFQGTGLEVTCAWRVVPDPVRRDRVYYCYMDIGLLISDDCGQTFRRSSAGMKMGQNCFGVLVDPQVPETIWAATGWWNRNEGDLCRSDDGGASWRVVGHPDSGLPVGQVLEMALDLSSPVGQRRLLVASNGHGFFESRDGGDSWQEINGDLPADAARAPRGLLLDPADPQHIITATRRHLFETRDGGRTWQRLDAEDVFGDVKHLAADPGDFVILYVAAREYYDHQASRSCPGGAFRSDDGGRTWRQMLDFRFAHCVAVSPADSRILYVATTDHPFHDEPVAEGVLKSTDGGQTWHRENTGLTLRNIKMVCVSPHDPSLLFASTSGNSVFVGRDGAVRPPQAH